MMVVVVDIRFASESQDGVDGERLAHIADDGWRRWTETFRGIAATG